MMSSDRPGSGTTPSDQPAATPGTDPGTTIDATSTGSASPTQTSPTTSFSKETRSPSTGPTPADDKSAAEPLQASSGPAAPAPDPVPDQRRVRPTTIVWGLVIMVLGAGVIANSLGYTIDLGLVAIALLAASGVALLISSVVRRG
jgi:hypothetical protein